MTISSKIPKIDIGYRGSNIPKPNSYFLGNITNLKPKYLRSLPWMPPVYKIPWNELDLAHHESFCFRFSISSFNVSNQLGWSSLVPLTVPALNSSFRCFFLLLLLACMYFPSAYPLMIKSFIIGFNLISSLDHGSSVYFVWDFVARSCAACLSLFLLDDPVILFEFPGSLKTWIFLLISLFFAKEHESISFNCTRIGWVIRFAFIPLWNKSSITQNRVISLVFWVTNAIEY